MLEAARRGLATSGEFVFLIIHKLSWGPDLGWRDPEASDEENAVGDAVDCGGNGGGCGSDGAGAGAGFSGYGGIGDGLHTVVGLMAVVLEMVFK